MKPGEIKNIRDYMRPPRSVSEMMERELADVKLRKQVERIVERMRAEQDREAEYDRLRRGDA